jgi:hypothetical protein
MILMTGAASDAVYSLSVSTANLHRVAMAVVTLTRKVATGMTIHAARMAKHWNNCFESRSGTDIIVRHDFTSKLCISKVRSLNGNP